MVPICFFVYKKKTILGNWSFSALCEYFLVMFFYVSSFDMNLRFLGSIWYISDYNLSYPEFTIPNFQNPEIFVNLPDFEGEITTKTHSNHYKMNVFAVSRLREWFPTILGMFPGSLTAEK